MKKIAVILISAVLIVSFAILVYYSLRHGWGIPTVAEKMERAILEAPFLDKEINLAEGIAEEVWETFPEKKIKLMYQLMVLPWPKSVTPEIFVQAFHNQNDIYFSIRWRDDTQDRDLGINKFSDACAMMFPLEREVQPPSIMMGFIGKANIWQWKAVQDKEYWKGIHPKTEAYADYYYPFEEKETLVVSKTIPKSAVNDLLSIRVGTVTPKETQHIEGRGFWQDGTWQVVFKRRLKANTQELDAEFSSTEKKLCAFAVWNGSKGDRGGRKSISDWVELVLK